MIARHVLCTGLRIHLSSCRTDPPTAPRAAAFAVAILFPEQSPRTIEGVVIKPTYWSGTYARSPALAQAEQVAPIFFLAEQIRRSTVMSGQPAHCLGVGPSAFLQPIRPGSAYSVRT